jgi:hypothetical protein
MGKPPLREVKSATWASGWRYGRMKTAPTIWTLTLVCGHVVQRTDKTGDLKKPKSARCYECAKREPNG